MSMVVFEHSTEKEEEREDSNSSNEQPISSSNYFAVRRSKDPSKSFSLN